MPEPPFPYRASTEAPTITWPGGAPVAVWVALNIEHYPVDRPGLSLVPVTAGNVPDPMNYGWRDYGVRVGTFSLIELLDELKVPVTAPVHSEACARYPQIVEAGVAREWSWMAHGADNAAVHVDLDADMERTMLSECVQAIEAATGRRPLGWLGPALSETFNTPALLAELGLTYACDRNRRQHRVEERRCTDSRRRPPGGRTKR